MLMLIILFGYDPSFDIIGSLVGHIYFFCDEVVPRIPETEDVKIFRAPLLLKRVCDYF